MNRKNIILMKGLALAVLGLACTSTVLISAVSAHGKEDHEARFGGGAAAKVGGAPHADLLVENVRQALSEQHKALEERMDAARKDALANAAELGRERLSPQDLEGWMAAARAAINSHDPVMHILEGLEDRNQQGAYRNLFHALWAIQGLKMEGLAGVSSTPTTMADIQQMLEALPTFREDAQRLLEQQEAAESSGETPILFKHPAQEPTTEEEFEARGYPFREYNENTAPEGFTRGFCILVREMRQATLLHFPTGGIRVDMGRRRLEERCNDLVNHALCNLFVDAFGDPQWPVAPEEVGDGAGAGEDSQSA